ncbi:MAG TPA: ATP-dependent zinc metalloprotease FtsH [Pirellulales bacterium]|nr:ATP-dependent zinc metalloprotease FtsH [Pirellulales bacterium]
MESNPKTKKPSSGKATPEKKSPPIGNNFVWYLLGIGVTILLVIGWLRQDSAYELQYSDLLNVISAGKDGYKVEEGPEGHEKEVLYKNPTDIVISSSEVTGKISREVVGGADESADNSLGSSTTNTTSNGSSATATSAASAHTVPFHTNKGVQLSNDERLEKFLQENKIRYSYSEPPSLWHNYVPMLVLSTLFILVFLFMLRRLGGAGSPMAFGRSRGKMYAQEDIGITFEDVAGIDEAVEELREVVEFLRQPERYQVLGGRIPKGVMLVGPPGTGKTLLAKAIAGEAGVPFFSLSGSDFVEMFVGVGAARVRDMFQQAEAKAPCIIFIDELDALGKTRGSSVVGGHDEREQTLNALLVEMDGFNSNSGVIVLAASNRPETLDPALLRPGRFDRHVLVDRPDVRGREEILKVHVQNVKLDSAVNLREIAGLTSGFVGADLANLVNEAALLAARKGKNAVGVAEFNEGVERVTAGLEKRKRVIHADEKQRVAYHEAAHALVAYSLPNTDPVHKVSIIPRGLAALGYTMQRPEDDRYLMTQSELESRIQVLLAGTIAEEMIFDDVSTGASNDLERASDIARSMVMDYGMSRMGRVNYRQTDRSPFLVSSTTEFGRARMHSEQTAREIDEEVKRIVDESMGKVRQILAARKASLESLAKRLIDRETIDGVELKQIIEETSPSPQIVPGTEADRKRHSAQGVVEAPLPRETAEGSL